MSNCQTCGQPVQGAGAKTCDGCWEVEHRIASYLRDGGAKARDKLVALIADAMRDVPVSEADALLARVYGPEDQVAAERKETVMFLRVEADRHRAVANDMRIKRATADAHAWTKIAEALGNIANRIERLEHRSEK